MSGRPAPSTRHAGECIEIIHLAASSPLTGSGVGRFAVNRQGFLFTRFAASAASPWGIDSLYAGALMVIEGTATGRHVVGGTVCALKQLNYYQWAHGRICTWGWKSPGVVTGREGRVWLYGPVADTGQGARMSKGLIKGIFKMGEVNDSALMERDAYQVKLNFFKLRILV